MNEQLKDDIKTFLVTFDKVPMDDTFTLSDSNNLLNRAVSLLHQTINDSDDTLIECFSNVDGHKEAQDVVIDLNQMKSPYSENFYIDYDRSDISHEVYMVVGKVTKKDWADLNLDMDFLVLTLS